MFKELPEFLHSDAALGSSFEPPNYGMPLPPPLSLWLLTAKPSLRHRPAEGGSNVDTKIGVALGAAAAASMRAQSQERGRASETNQPLPFSPLISCEECDLREGGRTWHSSPPSFLASLDPLANKNSEADGIAAFLTDKKKSPQRDGNMTKASIVFIARRKYKKIRVWRWLGCQCPLLLLACLQTLESTTGSEERRGEGTLPRPEIPPPPSHLRSS